MTRSNENPASGASGLRPDVVRTLEKLEKREADELARTWQLAGLAADPEPDQASVAAATERFSSAIESDVRSDGARIRQPERPPHARRSSGRRRTVVRGIMTASVVAIVGLTAIGLWPRTTTVTVPPGELAEETLPDGSHVVLSSSSALAYQTGPFADPRRVELDGEAYFTVTEDDRTFRVETFNATVTALGTAFNVRAVEASRRPSTRVALASGVVKLNAAGAGNGVWLRPGELSVVDRSGIPSAPRKVSVDAEASWRDGGFTMLDQSLYAVTEQLERRFGVAIELRPEYIGNDTLSINLPQAAGAEVVLGDVCDVIGCRYRAQAGGFLVESDS